MFKGMVRAPVYVKANKALQASFTMSTSSLLSETVFSAILSPSIYIQSNQNFSCLA